MEQIIKRVQEQLDNNHAVSAEDIQVLVDWNTQKIKRQRNRDMPIEMIRREEYNEWLELMDDLNEFFSKMAYNPEAEMVNNLHKRITEILDRYEESKSI